MIKRHSRARARTCLCLVCLKVYCVNTVGEKWNRQQEKSQRLFVPVLIGQHLALVLEKGFCLGVLHMWSVWACMCVGSCADRWEVCMNIWTILCGISVWWGFFSEAGRLSWDVLLALHRNCELYRGFRAAGLSHREEKKRQYHSWWRKNLLRFGINAVASGADNGKRLCAPRWSTQHMAAKQFITCQRVSRIPFAINWCVWIMGSVWKH